MRTGKKFKKFVFYNSYNFFLTNPNYLYMIVASTNHTNVELFVKSSIAYMEVSGLTYSNYPSPGCSSGRGLMLCTTTTIKIMYNSHNKKNHYSIYLALKIARMYYAMTFLIPMFSTGTP